VVPFVLAACSSSSPAPAATVASRTPKGGPAHVTPSPSALRTPSPSPPGNGPIGEIELSNLTFGHAESTPVAVTEPIDPPADTVVLAHVMGFRPSEPTPPTLTGAGLTWSLVGGNLDGEKRHFVYRGIGHDPMAGPVSIDWGGQPTETLWIIDVARGAATGNDGADAIVQFASQESQRNAASGSIELQPFADPVHDAAVCFALAGSGAASDIAPAHGFTETAEADNPGQNLIISDFWWVGDHTSCDADFLHESGALEVESWLFLAVELRAANT
jgi:hypothetical protein